ncbi:hypothetical protein JH06_1710 [Blastocystis sp. subtype 4]|uniref:hypothetical protein n=1 Tax=Blastocystis sp. subtype 4 TaxID=944170 RepID=UPI0007119857|nr:hypothetical protein JH06_1710 [Blastocystis sp. subtype 4]KNB44379.1 hypothetical protein JH06_1710 [Blastocystis sp. subtype 4]|eukprot:XP_014527822.1 hypothetical protein JH06_1710 [Blastocystis sp. subtype 4]
MPPKKREMSKNEMKKVEKFVEDKTFGLKNKNKSKKVQEYVQNVKKVYTGKDAKSEELRRREAKKMRDAKKEQEKELSDLFKAVITAPKLAFGEDPKSVLCPFFKAGRCDKGDRCKYSHDLNLNTRKSAKKDIHTDHRDEKAQETNADWDRDKLEEVLRQKEGKRPQTTTKIVCKYFLDAIEKECYGWFWQCPNGPDCKYRHALPEGYVYKSRAEREAEAAMREADRAQDKNMMRLENIEYLRSQLPHTNLTPVTPETFAKWKQERMERKKKEKEEIEKASEKKKVSSKEARLLSGRALFIFNPNLFVDDEGAAENKEYEVVDPMEEEENAKEGKEEVVNIAEAAEAAAAAAEAAGEGEAEEEEVKISLTVFADEDLEDLPSDDEDEGETQKEKEPPSQLTTQPS